MTASNGIQGTDFIVLRGTDSVENSSTSAWIGHPASTLSFSFPFSTQYSDCSKTQNIMSLPLLNNHQWLPSAEKVKGKLLNSASKSLQG